MRFLQKRFEKGFTLIELLIVIAVIGVLIAIVLLAINPLEQLARGRDANRKTAVAQLGRALSAYITTQSLPLYPPPPAGFIPAWQTSLRNAGEVGNIIVVPVSPRAAPAPCAANAEGNMCYSSTGPNAVIWTILESASETDKSDGVTGGGTCTTAPTHQAVVVWDSSQGRAGLLCLTGDPDNIPNIGAALN